MILRRTNGVESNIDYKKISNRTNKKNLLKEFH